MKTAIRFIVVLLLTIIISSVWDTRPDDFFMSTIYTVTGIIFSIGLSLIVTFSFHGLKNKAYINHLRKNLFYIRQSFIVYFSIATICYILDKYIGKECFFKTFFNYDIKLSFSILFCLLIFYAIIYFIVNLLAIQKLNNDLFDKINEEC